MGITTCRTWHDLFKCLLVQVLGTSNFFILHLFIRIRIRIRMGSQVLPLSLSLSLSLSLLSSSWYENENPRTGCRYFLCFFSWSSSIRDRRTKRLRRVPLLLGQPLSFLIDVTSSWIWVVFRSPLPRVKGPSSWNLLGKKTALFSKDRKILEKSKKSAPLQRAISTLGRVQSRQEGC